MNGQQQDTDYTSAMSLPIKRLSRKTLRTKVVTYPDAESVKTVLQTTLSGHLQVPRKW